MHAACPRCRDIGRLAEKVFSALLDAICFLMMNSWFCKAVSHRILYIDPIQQSLKPVPSVVEFLAGALAVLHVGGGWMVGFS